MQIQFKGTNYELAADMTDFAEAKLGKLKKYLGTSEKPILAYVDLGKLTEAHQSGAIWYAETNIDIGGERHNAKASAETLRTAIEKMAKELGQELRTIKKKRESLTRKEGSRFKDMFRFGR